MQARLIITALTIIFMLRGCTDPVDAYLNALDARINTACECTPLISLASGTEECYMRLEISSTERNCIRTAFAESKPTNAVLSCHTMAEEDFIDCLDYDLRSCDLYVYADCEDVYQAEIANCSNTDSFIQTINQCLNLNESW